MMRIDNQITPLGSALAAIYEHCHNAIIFKESEVEALSGESKHGVQREVSKVRKSLPEISNFKVECGYIDSGVSRFR